MPIEGRETAPASLVGALSAGEAARYIRNGGVPPPEAPGSAALYIATLAEELARLAKSHDLDALAYLLDMARLEAD